LSCNIRSAWSSINKRVLDGEGNPLRFPRTSPIEGLLNYLSNDPNKAHTVNNLI
jgi:hypothetical protein